VVLSVQTASVSLKFVSSLDVVIETDFVFYKAETTILNATEIASILREFKPQ